MAQPVKPKSSPAFLALVGVTGAVFVTALVLTFFVAPTERMMGIVQKIFYFHVPAAIVMGVLFLVCAVASLAYLLKNDARLDAVGATAAELAVVFGAIALITGPLWARKAWGAWWTWEPRLTLTLLSVFIYAGYLAMRAYGGEKEFSRRVAAGLGLMGAPAYYFIKVAVDKWGGNHPKNVVYGKGEGLMNPDMRMAFFGGLIAVLLLTVTLFVMRYRTRMLKERVDNAILEMQKFDLLEDG